MTPYTERRLAGHYDPPKPKKTETKKTAAKATKKD